MSEIDDEAVGALRRFNRSYTSRIGALDESYLRSGRPLGAARLLWEIGADGASIRELRRRLRIDSGYLSRLLRQLERDGSVQIERDLTDGRRRVALLTATGRREWRRLEQRSAHKAAAIVVGLTEAQRDELVDALATVDRLLFDAAVRIEVVDPESADARVALDRYFSELDERFDHGFDPSAHGTPTDRIGMTAPHGAFVVLRVDGEVVGCGALTKVDGDTGEIKRMWVDRGQRGRGIGLRLVGELEAIARDLGRRRIVLDTNGTLTEAIAMYGRAGYSPIERYNDNVYAQHWFGKSI